MFAIAGILLIVAIILVIDLPTLRRNKSKKEIWVFSLLLLFGTVLAIARSLDVQIPNPMDLIIMVYKPVADLVSVWLK